MAQRVGITRRTLARLMREARKNAGLKGGTAAQQAGLTAPTLSKYERAEHPWPPAVVYQLSDLYGLPPNDRDTLVELAKQPPLGAWATATPEWFSPYVGAESEATEIALYHDALVPGLFQVADYARALISAAPRPPSAAELEERVSVRMRRQQRLQGDAPLRCRAVVNEAALHRAVGDTNTMRRQLQHLLDVSEYEGVELRVLPFSVGAHAASEGSFVYLRFPDIIDGLPSGDVVYIEHAAGSLFLEPPDDTAKFARLHQAVCDAALTPTSTRDFIRSLLRSDYS
ncbi:helix-turn-helix domain-containing protein [Nocardiopsis coralliicola]